MMPLRRGKGGREDPPEGSEKAPEQADSEELEGAVATAPEDAAAAERRAQKEAVRADKEATKKAKREAKAERRRERRDRRADKRNERRRAKERKAEEKAKPKAEKPKPKPTAEKPKPRAEKPKPKPRAEKPKPKPRAEKPKPKPRAEKPKPRKERAGAGGALKSAGSQAGSALTGPRAKQAAERVDGGIQTAWKLLLAGLGTLLAGALVIGRFVLGGLRELGALWIRSAEILGGAILWAYRRVVPIVLAALRGLRRALAWAERVVTPQRAVAVVVIAAAATLAASQFVDYRGIRIGAPDYAGVEAVAPAPQTDRAPTGSVHGYAMVPVAVVIIIAALLALRGRWRVARVIPILAALAVAVTLLLDARKGLDEGDAAVAYQGAQAVLIEGFWLQLASASVLVVTGILLVHYARRAGAPARRRTPAGNGREPSRRRKRRFRIAGVRA